jgi:hypothetical protein
LVRELFATVFFFLNKKINLLKQINILAIIFWIPWFYSELFIKKNNASLDPFRFFSKYSFLLIHVMNPIVYGFLSKNFRKDCLKLFRIFKKKIRSCLFYLILFEIK